MENKIFQTNIIGKQISVVDSKNQDLLGKKGKIVMETKNMIYMDNKIAIPKNSVDITILGLNEKVIISGKILIGTIDNRIKKQGVKKENKL